MSADFLVAASTLRRDSSCRYGVDCPTGLGSARIHQYRGPITGGRFEGRVQTVCGIFVTIQESRVRGSSAVRCRLVAPLQALPAVLDLTQASIFGHSKATSTRSPSRPILMLTSSFSLQAALTRCSAFGSMSLFETNTSNLRLLVNVLLKS